MKIDALSFAVVAAEQSGKPLGPEELRNYQPPQVDYRSTLARLFPSHLELAVMMAAAPGRHEAKLNRFFMLSGTAKMGSFDSAVNRAIFGHRESLDNYATGAGRLDKTPFKDGEKYTYLQFRGNRHMPSNQSPSGWTLILRSVCGKLSAFNSPPVGQSMSVTA